jgi:hypothetical protein
MSARSFHHHKARRIMRNCIVGFSLAALLLVVTGAARTEEGGDAKAVIAKAIKAVGGEEKIAKALKGFSLKEKGTLSIMGSDNPISIEVTAAGLDKYRSKFKGEFGGMEIEGVTVLSGDKGTRSFAGMDMEMDKEGIASEKRNIYLAVIASLVLPLNEKGFKSEAAGEEKVDGKAAVVLKVTGPDGKDSKLYFDKETGLPVRQVAKVMNFMMQEVTQESTYSNFKDMGGIKHAGKAIIKHDGEKLMELEITEFKILDKVDTKVFEKP